MKARSRCCLFLGSAIVLVSSDASSQERIGTSSQPLVKETGVELWTSHNNEVPVCWERVGFDREKAIVQRAVQGTWEYWANVRFTGWTLCPTGIGIGGSGTARHVRIRTVPQGTANSGAGGSARMGTAALSSADENNPGVTMSFNPDGSADEGRVEYIGVHEFGHVLGFAHEQDAPDNEGPAKCNSGVNPDSTAVGITAYDRDSVMNYCNMDGNMEGHLTDVDIRGAQQVYGVRRANRSAFNSCSSAPLGKRASLAAPWNDGGKTTVAVYPSDGTKFLYWSQWAIRDGGWGDEVRWVSGDFNADGRTDIGAIWNNQGSNVLTVRSSNGQAFSHRHWLENAGGWMNTTNWMAGDFDGDGRSDIAGAWNDAGQTSIAVYRSDGLKFGGWTQWSSRDGGWGETIRWFTGDFNGDGRTDVGAAWNNDGRLTLTVRLSDGTRFTPVHWRETAGHWWDSASFVAGDFNGDGRADVAQMWNDLGQNSIKVWLSSGTRFGESSSWSTRDGGWGTSIKWTPGDFNGDGRTDIAAVWNNGGTNTLTVRLSNGSAFAPAHWTTNGGGWMDSTAWCAGAFH